MSRAARKPEDLGTVGFEGLVEKVETILRDMQDGGRGLEELLGDYEAGMKYLLEAERRLGDARKRLEQLDPVTNERRPLQED
jgi:exodeoxyribonuclease VII small subunit